MIHHQKLVIGGYEGDRSRYFLRIIVRLEIRSQGPNKRCGNLDKAVQVLFALAYFFQFLRIKYQHIWAKAKLLSKYFRRLISPFLIKIINYSTQIP